MTLSRAVRLVRQNSSWSNALGLALALGAGLALVCLPPATALILAALGALAVASLVEPLIGVGGGLFLGLLRAYLQTEMPQIPAQIGHLFIALAAVGWVARGLLRRDLRLPLPPLFLPMLGFVAAGWLSLWNAADLPGYGLPELAKWLEVLLVFLIVADRLPGRSPFWLLIPVLLAGLFQASVGLYQFGLRGEGPDHFRIPGYEFYRAYGTFEQPNPYGGFIGMALALAIGVLVGLLETRGQGEGETRRGGDEETRGQGEGETRRGGDEERKEPPGNKRFLFGPLLVSLPVLLMGGALAASWSRGAWIGFGAALVAMAAVFPRRAGWGILAVALLAMLALGLYSANLLPPSVVARLTDFAAELRLEDVRGVGINSANYAVIERLAHWQSAVEMWRHRFWTGVGLGCYEAAYTDFALINWPFALGHAHNTYLNLLAETGLVGFLAYLILWAAVFWQTWRLTRHSDGLTRGIAIGLMGVWAHLSVHNFFDNLYVNNVHLMVGALMGVVAGLQVCRCASLQVCRCASLQVCRCASLQVCK